jgi:hypothetical protein
MVDFWIDVYAAGGGPGIPGTRLGDGPITTSVGWESTRRLDGAGSFRFTVPASDPRAALLENRRVVWCWAIVEGELEEIAAGVIERVDLSIDDPAMLDVRGQDLLVELTDRTVGQLRVHQQDWTLLNGGKGSVRSLSHDREWDLPEAYDGDFGTFTSAIDIRDDRFLYIGFDTRFDRVRLTFHAHNPGLTTTLEYQYFAGDSGWEGLTGVVDGTIVAGAPFAQDGIITFARPADWQRSTPTRAAGSWFWIRIRRFPGIGNNFSVQLTEVESYADMPTLAGIAQIMTHAPAAWAAGFPATVSEKYIEFDGESVLAALVTLAEHGGQDAGQAIREHFRLGVGRSLEWLGTATPPTGLRAMQPSVAQLVRGEAGVCLIRELSVQEDTEEVITRLYPVSSDGLRLALTDRTAPAGYTLNRTAGWVEHDAGKLAYGLIEAQIRFPEVQMQQADSLLLHPEMSANALFDRSIEYLRTHGTKQLFYRLGVHPIAQQLYPGTTIRVIYSAWDDAFRFIDIDDDLYITGVTTRVSSEGLGVVRLDVSTVDRDQAGEAEILARTVRTVRRPMPAAGQFTVQVTSVARPIVEDVVTNYLEVAQLRVSGAIILGNQGIIRSENYVTGLSGWAVRADGSAEFSNAVVRGTIEATLGSIGGWTIGAVSLTGGDAVLHSSGYLSLGTGDNIVRLDAMDPDHRVWIGSSVAAHAPFRVTRTGALTALGATIVGTIEAMAGLIANWSIQTDWLVSNNLTLHSAGYIQVGSGHNTVRLDALNADWRLWIGHATDPLQAPFRVSPQGVMTATQAVITGTVFANSGFIGGWSITTDHLQKLTANIGIRLDSITPAVRVGNVLSTHVVLDGSAGTVGVSNYVPGVSGWQITAAGRAEFLDASFRGTLRVSVFERATTSVVGGSFFVARSAGALAANYVPGGTMTIEGADWAFNTGEIVYIRARHTAGPVAASWMTVTRTGTTNVYTTTLQSGSAGVTYPSGTAVTGFGTSGQGYIHLSALDPHGAHINIATHAGAPWSTTTTQARLGNLRDSYGIGAVNTYGFAFGDFAAGRYIRWDGTNLDVRGRIYVHPTVATELADWTHASDRTMIDGGDIFARSVTAERLTVQSGNYLENPDFQTGNLLGWTVEPNVTVTNVAPNSGAFHMRMFGTGAWEVRAYSNPIPAAAGSRWSAKAWVRTSSGTRGANIQVVFLDSGFNFLALAHTVDDAVGTTYKLITRDEALAPANTRYVQIRLAVRATVTTLTSLYWDDVELQKADNALYITEDIKFNRDGVHLLNASVWTGWGSGSTTIWTSIDSGHQHTISLFGHGIKINNVWHRVHAM